MYLGIIEEIVISHFSVHLTSVLKLKLIIRWKTDEELYNERPGCYDEMYHKKREPDPLSTGVLKKVVHSINYEVLLSQTSNLPVS